jgi:predicted ArsR family transcriptional regulator
MKGGIEDGDITLANCPFHTLAQEYTELVRGMNLRLLDGLASTGLNAHLDPAPPRCCLRLQPADPRSATHPL